MTMLPTLPYAETITNVNTPLNPLLGGSLGIGPTGLNGISRLPGVGQLPFANQLGSLATGPAAPRGLPYVGAAANDIAALRPLTSSTASMAADTGLAAQLGRAAGGSPFRFNPSGLGIGGIAARGAGGFALGSIGSSLVDQINPGGQNSNIEQGLQGASIGAGIGGALGAPLFGIGAVPGALIGGGIGGAVGVLSNIFGGGGDDKKADPVSVLANAMQTAALTPEQQEQVLQTYETQMALAAGLEDDARAAAEAQAANTAGTMILQMLSQQEAASAAAPSQANLLALQAQAAQLYEPVARDIEQNAQLYAQAMQHIAPNLPESYRAVADATTARELQSGNKLANAYRAQAALTPAVQRLTQYQQDQQAYAAQLFQQALAGQATGTTGATADLLSQLAG